ncbi:armadillo-type protein [Boletus reticuloceps]|uniref:Armadillo-type protein n=1 Tax=Boletus reticuloceps TaxID=495285 RepID=A0A8I2YF87_9AGAM|nr:armadillo-type protein [Boletus reticuloceps]
MDYLRNLGSAAVSTLVQKSGINLPFTLGQKVASCETFWVLYDATKRDDGSPVSVFEYDFVHPLNKPTIPLAKNALRKLRTIRHPDVLKFMDVAESESAILIMTERVRPLSAALQTWASKSQQERQDWLLWGLHRVSVALAFINDSAASTHGSVRPDAIFISPSGEWKLGGFEVLSNPKDDNPVLYTMGGLIPGSMSCAPPEVKKNGWSMLKDGPSSAADSYALGLLLHSVFNPTHPPPETSEPPHPPPQPSSRGAIPPSVFPCFKKLLNPNPKARMTPKIFLDTGMAETAGEASGFFANNRLVKVCGGLDNFSLGSEVEKATLLRTLKESASSFPPEFASFRILPSLVTALEYGGASAATIVPLVLQFGKNVSPDEYMNILGPLIRLFASPDRGTRMALLDSLSDYADKVDKKAVVDKIWPNLQSGFTDTVPVIREATIRAIVLLSPKLSDRILNNDLLRHLARLQSDPEASIRTNTCILIGRLGPTLGYNTKQKVLVPAFSKALKDSFVHARVAGLVAFTATSECFNIEDVAAKVIPSIVGATLDKEKIVRDQAFKAMELFMKRLETHAASMPETAQVEGDGNASLVVPGGFTQASLVNSATGAAGAFAGWAMSSLGRKLAPGDLQSTIASTSDERPLTPSNGTDTPSRTIPSTSFAQPKGLQLGGSNTNAKAVAVQLAEKVAAEEGGNSTWAGNDLMDVNADEGDWNAFESAPAAVVSRFTSAADLGFGTSRSNSPKGEDDWGTMDTLASPLKIPTSTLWGSPRLTSRALSPQPQARKLSSMSGISPASSHRHTPISSSPALPADPDPAPKSICMSKEEKANEMARRKEERRLRIERLKGQKKTAVSAAK